MNSDSKFFVGILIVAALAIGGLIAFTSVKKNTSNVDTSQGHKKGSDSAPVKIVEFTDFQCPYCAVAAPIMKQVVADNPDKVQLITRYFPLDQHVNSMPAARATEAASRQGKFWEMYERIFADQTTWESSSDVYGYFESYAKQLGLDLNTFARDYNDSSEITTIQADYNYGISLGVDSTPSFFVNGTKYTGAKSAGEWQKIIDEAAASASPSS